MIHLRIVLPSTFSPLHQTPRGLDDSVPFYVLTQTLIHYYRIFVRAYYFHSKQNEGLKYKMCHVFINVLLIYYNISLVSLERFLFNLSSLQTKKPSDTVWFFSQKINRNESGFILIQTLKFSLKYKTNFFFTF